MSVLAVIHAEGVVVLVARAAEREACRRMRPARNGAKLSREQQRKLAREERRQKPGEMKN